MAILTVMLLPTQSLLEVILCSYFHAAGIDFAPDDVLVTFAPDDQAACGKIAILNDQQVGESREVFAVLLSLPVDIPYIALGSPDTVNVIVTDTPGMCTCLTNPVVKVNIICIDFALQMLYLDLRELSLQLEKQQAV